MAVTRLRVELKDYNPHASAEEKFIAFKRLLAIFNKAYERSRILQDFKRHEHFESPGERRRRKRKENKSRRLREEASKNGEVRRKKRKFKRPREEAGDSS